MKSGATSLEPFGTYSKQKVELEIEAGLNKVGSGKQKAWKGVSPIQATICGWKNDTVSYVFGWKIL